jgi:hypothetical protein
VIITDAVARIRQQVADLARQLGEPVAIAPADIGSLDHRYQHAYGQESTR